MSRTSAAIGLALKETAMEQMEKSLDKVFIATMRDLGRHLCLLHGSVSMDDIRKAADVHNLSPSIPNVFGAIFRGPHWVKVDRKISEYESNHGRSIAVWEYKE